jgi:hypothetical protein
MTGDWLLILMMMVVVGGWISERCVCTKRRRKFYDDERQRPNEVMGGKRGPCVMASGSAFRTTTFLGQNVRKKGKKMTS